MKKVIVESPFMYRSENESERVIGQLRNTMYARLALRDCILRGETPYASHLLLTQPGILDDDNSNERRLGIDAGLEFGKICDMSAFYTDLGYSTGMKYGLQSAQDVGRPIDKRQLDGWNNALNESPSETLIRLELFSEQQIEFLASNSNILGAFGLKENLDIIPEMKP